MCATALLEGWGQLVPTDDGRGYRRGMVECHLEMDCDDPYSFELFATTRKIEARKSAWAVIHTRCRVCDPCLRRRSRLWAGKAITEFNKWPRTWFGTFTASPEIHERLDLEIEVHGVGRKGTRGYRPPQNLNSVSAEYRFELRARKFGEYITKWIKVLRKGDADHPAPRFRYLLIAEAHDSENTSSVMAGRPHYHILIHEQEAWTLVLGQEMEQRKYKTSKGYVSGMFARDSSFIRTAWSLGFTKFQIAESAGSVSYLCKYLTKSMRVRVRPSNGYGGDGGTGVPRRNGPPADPDVAEGKEATKHSLGENDPSLPLKRGAGSRSPRAAKGMGPVSREQSDRNGGAPSTLLLDVAVED